MFGITELDPGGAEQNFVELICRLDRNRWNPIVVVVMPIQSAESATAPSNPAHADTGMSANASPSERPCTLTDRLRDANVPIYSLNVRSSRDFWRGWSAWTKLIKEHKPAALLTFLFHANLLGRLAAWSANLRPVINSVRVAEQRPNGHRTLDWLTCRLVDHVSCVSQGVADHYHRATGFPHTKMSVIPNGVDADRFAQATSFTADELRNTPIKGDADLPILLFVGRLDPQKGLVDLLAALDNLEQQQFPLRMVLIGDGPLRPDLEAAGNTERRFTPITLLGRRSDVPRWMKSATALVLPSHWEGMPNVVLEAMSAGLPVIATSTEGTVELIQDGNSGLLVPIGNLQELCSAINKMLSDPLLRAKLASNARTTIQDGFQYKIMVERFDRLLSESIRQTLSKSAS